MQNQRKDVPISNQIVLVTLSGWFCLYIDLNIWELFHDKTWHNVSLLNCQNFPPYLYEYRVKYRATQQKVKKAETEYNPNFDLLTSYLHYVTNSLHHLAAAYDILPSILTNLSALIQRVNLDSAKSVLV